MERGMGPKSPCETHGWRQKSEQGALESGLGQGPGTGLELTDGHQGACV